MKKLVVFSVIFALVAGAVFADVASGISVNAWGRGLFVPFALETATQVDGKTVDGAESTVYAGSGVTWGGDPRVDFRIQGDREAAGFRVQLMGDGGNINVADDAFLWVKPFQNDMLKLTVGKFTDGTLAGPGSVLGNLAGLVLGGSVKGTTEDDSIFFRFRGGSRNSWELSVPPPGGAGEPALLATSAPMDGLFLGAMVQGSWNAGNEAKDVYRYIHIAAGYTIQDIGKFRLGWRGGYFGEKADDDDDFDASKPAKLDAAFALTAVDGLSLDIGFSTALPTTVGTVKSTGGSQVNLVGKFGLTDMINLGLGVGMDFGGYTQNDSNDKSANGMKLRVDLCPEFMLDFGTVGIGVAFAMQGDSTNAAGDAVEDGKNQLGFGAWVGKGVGGGNIKAGITYQLPVSNKDGAQGSGIFRIPIVFEYAVF